MKKKGAKKSPNGPEIKKRKVTSMAKMHVFEYIEKWGGGIILVPINNKEYYNELKNDSLYVYAGAYNFDNKFIEKFSIKQHLGEVIDLTWIE